MAGKINLKGVSGNSFQIGLNGVTIDVGAVTNAYTLQLPERLGNADESMIIGTNGNLEFGHTKKLVGDNSNISIDTDGGIRFAVNGQANVIAIESDGTNSNVFINSTLNLDNPSNLKIGGGSANYLLVSNGTDLEYRSADSLLVIPQIPKISFDVAVAGNNQSFTDTGLLEYRDNTNVLPMVYRNGVYVDDSTYTIVDDTITFNHYLRAGECVDISPSQTKVLAGVAGNVDLTGYATETFVNNAIANVTAGNVDLSAYATNLSVDSKIANIPIPNISGLASETFVTNSIANIPATDLSAYATNTSVDNKIANIPIPNISGLASETFVTNSIANIPATDLSAYATNLSVDNKIANITHPTYGNIANLNINGNASTVLLGNGTFSNVLPAPGNANTVMFNSGGNIASIDNFKWLSSSNLMLITAGRLFASTNNQSPFSGVRYSDDTIGAAFVTSKSRGQQGNAQPIQVGDDITGMLSSVYTGTGVTSVDGVSGWSPFFSSLTANVTALPTGNGFPSTSLRLIVSNATNNTSLTAMSFDSGKQARLFGNLVLSTGANSYVPATATSTGVVGQVAYDSSYVYICVATNTWKRSALATW